MPSNKFKPVRMVKKDHKPVIAETPIAVNKLKSQGYRADKPAARPAASKAVAPVDDKK